MSSITVLTIPHDGAGLYLKPGTKIEFWKEGVMIPGIGLLPYPIGVCKCHSRTPKSNVQHIENTTPQTKASTE